MSGTTPTYHYYLKDHLGNNRVVLNQNGTAVEQVNHYYPFGGLFDQTSETLQAYKYNGKELDRTYGIGLYDYSARFMDGAVGRFTTMDPLSEKYYSVSPYLYCGGNPVNRIDSDGRKIVFLIKTNNKTNSYEYMADGNLKDINTGEIYEGSTVKGHPGKIIAGYTRMLNSGDENYVNQIKTLINSENVHVIDATTSIGKNSRVRAGSGKMYLSEATDKAKKGEGIGTTTEFGDFSNDQLENSDVGKTSYTTIVHEVQHQFDYDQGNMKDFYDKNGELIGGQDSPAEQRAIKNEDKAREQEGLKPRRIY